MIKADTWDGGPLKGEWEVTTKIDGVRILKKGGKWVTRGEKGLFNLPDPATMPHDDYEVYVGNFTDTIWAVRTKDGRPIDKGYLYSLAPLDSRLVFAPDIKNPTAKLIKKLMNQCIADGNEGLVLRQGDKWRAVLLQSTVH